MSSLWLPLGAACTTGIFSLAAQRKLLARPVSFAAHVLALLAGIWFFNVFLLFTARPVASSLLAIATLALLFSVNQAKLIALREPLIPADVHLLVQVIKYPHLYLPFLPIKAMVLGFVAVGLVIGVLFFLETPGAFLRSTGFICCSASFVLLLPVLLTALKAGRLKTIRRFILKVFPPSSDAAHDMYVNGLWASGINHFAWAGEVKERNPSFLANCEQRPSESSFPKSLEQTLTELKNTPINALPHITIIQAESFYNMCKYADEPLKSSLQGFLPNWHTLQAVDRAFDPPPHAYGAYTMRAEFTMLTGLPPHVLGPWAFNPYLLASRVKLWSLAPCLKKLGYKTIVLHPYHKDFFGRDKAIPNLGFDEFYDISALSHLPTFGKYTSDIALADEITSILEHATGPVFCFAITMEAHGPWLAGRLTQKQITDLLPGIDVEKLPLNMQLYLCHLKNMDTMLGMLARYEGKRKNRVWAYGDHAPGGI